MGHPPGGDLESPNQGSSYCALWTQGRCLPTSCALPGATASGHRPGEAAPSPRGTRAPCREREQPPGPLTHRRTPCSQVPSIQGRGPRVPRSLPHSSFPRGQCTLDLRGLTDALSAAPGYAQGPWLIGVGHCRGRGTEGFTNSLCRKKLFAAVPLIFPVPPGLAGTHTHTPQWGL